MKLYLTVASLLALAAPMATQAGSPPADMAQKETAGRQSMTLGSDWRFRFGETGDAPAAPGFDDSSWDSVSVPHSWNRLGSYGTERAPGTDNRQGIGWYRLTMRAPSAGTGPQRYYLDFGAVSKIADIWVNGVHVGTHKGGFARFRLDVTQQWKPGVDNLIAVRADNSKPVAGASTAETLPLAGDFFVHGGMYRAVSLLTLPDVSFDPLDFGGPGLYARTSAITTDKATVHVLARLRSSAVGNRRLTLVTTIADADGKAVARSERPVRIIKGASEQAIDMVVPSPHLWNGTADPYLYSVRAELVDKGRPIDSVVQPLGIRDFRIDPDKGFFLNGKHVALHGVSRHQDRPDVGWALTSADHAQDMAMAVDMGANTIREAHYQQADEWSDEADRAGMVVWAELPYVTSPSVTGGQGSPELWANAEQQLRELIRQKYNHPSVMMWSIGNEVDSAKGFGVGQEPMKPLALLQHLNVIAKAEDPFRPTIFADCCEGLSLVKTAGEKLAGTADLIGYNRYYGWYYPQPRKAREQLGGQLDILHAKHPKLPISLSEYGAGGATSQHSDNVADGYLNFTGSPHPEEYQSWYHEENWAAIRQRPFVFASWVWNMFDFASDLRKEGDSIDINNKGLVTADRKERKDAFYFFKAQWSSKPTLHLTQKRYTERAYRDITIKAYSNAAKAELTLNGSPVGTASCTDGICLWPHVILRPGDNRIVASAEFNRARVSDEANWNGPDPAKGIFVNAGDLGSSVIAGQRYGSDDFVTGGIPVVLNMGGFGGRRMMAPRTVEAAVPALYDYWREGDAFSYAIPVANGRWTVTLDTFEPRNALTEPVTMRVSANGKAALAPFDVSKQAGGALRGLRKQFNVRVTDGVLKLDFAGEGGRAVVAAIAVTPR